MMKKQCVWTEFWAHSICLVVLFLLLLSVGDILYGQALKGFSSFRLSYFE